MMIRIMSSISQEQYAFMGDDTGVHVVFFLELFDCILGKNFLFF